MLADELPSRGEQPRARHDSVLPIPGLLTTLGMRDLSPSGAQLALLRIAQEALNNCAKHARASAIAVVLRRDGEQVTLAVYDDGCGFESGRATSCGDREVGLGLLQMREQAAAWGGCLDVSWSAAEETVVRATLPLVAPGGAGR